MNVDGEYELGHIGYLIEVSPQFQGNHYLLSDRPPRTNQSHEFTLHGWCGSWNNTSTYGRGIAEVTKVFGNGRVRIKVLTGEGKDGYFAKQGEYEKVFQFLGDTGFEDEFEIRKID